MRFMMFMYPRNQRRGLERRRAEDVAAMSRYNEELRKAGMLLALDGLHPPGDGARVSFDGDGERDASPTGPSPRPRRSSAATG